MENETPQPNNSVNDNQDLTNQVIPLATNADTTPKTAPQNPESIYPVATQGIGVDNQQPLANIQSDNTIQTTAESNKNNLIILLVIILGAYTAISALVGIFASTLAISYGFIGAGGLLIAIDVIYILIGIGLILRKELARFVYVVLAILGLLLTIYGTVHIFNSHAFKVIDYVKTQETQTINRDQQQITNIQNNNPSTGLQLTDVQKQQAIQNLQLNISRIKKSRDKLSNSRLYFGLIQGYLLAIVPLVFLTRPSVKKLFS